MKRFIYLLLFATLAGCIQQNKPETVAVPLAHIKPQAHYTFTGEIPVPAGFERIPAAAGSFADWLRALPLKKDKTVYQYNGKKKQNQSAQFAVLDISQSKTDLQQCADVVMRLRAEYLFAAKKFDSIRFMDYSRKWYNWTGKDNREKFDAYLQLVFGWCGSASLEKQLKPVENFEDIKAGDVLIKGGFPGHAVIVTDIAVNSKGQKVFILVQGYQPAQDMHVLLNPSDERMSPWYNLPVTEEIITPEWRFYRNQLFSW
ncbi:MAG: DUF4846 domain-containing protein [Bacteroidota bacterium]